MMHKLINHICFIGIFFISILFVFSTRQAHALSCAESYPIIGTVVRTKEEDHSTKVFITKLYTFDNLAFKSGKIYNIDKYIDLAVAYINSNTKDLSQIPNTYLETFNAINIPTTGIDNNLIEAGDVIINGYPFYVCDNGFTGIFDKNGNIKTAIIQDQYEDYSYKQNQLIVEPDQELECDNRTNQCKVIVKFKLGQTTATLNPGQTHNYTNEIIKGITLLDSSNIKSDTEYNSLSEWGIGIYAKYIIFFTEVNPIKIKDDIPPTPDNLYTRIISWLMSLF